MPVGEVGVGGKGPMVRRDRLVGPARLLEQPAEVEVRDGIARRVLDRGAIVGLGPRGLAGGVVEAAQIDVRVGQARVERERLLVGVARLGG